MKRFLIGTVAVLALWLSSSPSTTLAQQPLVVTALAEKKVAELPAGPLFWRIETFATVAQAQAAAGAWALAVESAGKFWPFTLGPAGGHQWVAPRLGKSGQFPGSRHRSISSGLTKLAGLRAA